MSALDALRMTGRLVIIGDTDTRERIAAYHGVGIHKDKQYEFLTKSFFRVNELLWQNVDFQMDGRLTSADETLNGNITIARSMLHIQALRVTQIGYLAEFLEATEALRDFLAEEWELAPGD